MIDGVAWLFCPADRPERYGKAAARSDVVILDLEDAVAPRDRARARAALIDNPLDPQRTMVRVNPVGTADHAEDLAALDQTAYSTLMLAKTETAAQVAGLAPRSVVALCETPLGVLNAASIAAETAVAALMWGAEDLVAALGGHSSRDDGHRYRDIARHARSTVLMAAGAYAKKAVDAVYLDIPDLSGLSAETDDAVASGFAAKACIHPSQVEVVRDRFRPSAEAIAWAQRVVAAAADEPGVFRFEGQMIDEPVLRQARTVLALSPRSAESNGPG